MGITGTTMNLFPKNHILYIKLRTSFFETLQTAINTIIMMFVGGKLYFIYLVYDPKKFQKICMPLNEKEYSATLNAVKPVLAPTAEFLLCRYIYNRERN